jgi:uncharacterized Ntn-hydrolase superfamily protein
MVDNGQRRGGTYTAAGNVTRLTARAGAASPEAFVDEAERLLERSRAELRPEEQVTWSYRAALRAAGAVIQSARKKRRRLPAGSAWVRVRVLAPDMTEWADEFEEQARFVARVEMGLEHALTPAAAAELYARACDFVDAVRERTGYLGEGVA